MEEDEERERVYMSVVRRKGDRGGESVARRGREREREREGGRENEVTREME